MDLATHTKLITPTHRLIIYYYIHCMAMCARMHMRVVMGRVFHSFPVGTIMCQAMMRNVMVSKPFRLFLRAKRLPPGTNGKNILIYIYPGYCPLNLTNDPIDKRNTQFPEPRCLVGMGMRPTHCTRHFCTSKPIGITPIIGAQ